MKAIFSFAVAVLAGATFATPEVSNVTVERNEATHVVKVSYELSEEGIVTARFFNGSDELTPEDVGPFGGEISRNLAAGDHVFYLRPETAAGNVFFDGAGNVKVELTAWPLDCPPPYMAVDLLAKETRKFYPSERWVPGGVTNRLYKTDVMLMRKIIAKDIKWPMGTVSSTSGFSKGTDMLPRYVTLTYDYYMAIYETTQKQYLNFLPDMKYDATNAKGITRAAFHSQLNDVDTAILPHENVSWQELRNGVYGSVPSGAFLWPADEHKVSDDSWLGIFRARTGIQVDIPTEAEWEYACRAGSAALHYDEPVDGIAWNENNWKQDPDLVAHGNSNRVHEVGLLKPNGWGLYDMLGNVYEQCMDYMPNDTSGSSRDKNLEKIQEKYYNFEGELTDPVGPGGKDDAQLGLDIEVPTNANRPRRGGNYTDDSTAKTDRLNPFHRIRHTSVNGYATAGFRVACPATIPSLSAE